MAIKNTQLGGTDWVNEEFFKSSDLNDTFNAAANKVRSLSAFWLNSYLYDFTESFESYTTDSNTFSLGTIQVPTNQITTDAMFDVTNYMYDTSYSAAYFVAKNSQLAGGTGKEGVLRATKTNSDYRGDASCLVKIKGLAANKHTFIPLYIYEYAGGSNGSHGGMSFISFNKGTNYDPLLATTGNNDDHNSQIYTNVLIIAKGSNEYDCYLGGKLIRTVTDSTFQIWISAQAATGGITTKDIMIYLGDIKQAKYSA